MHPITARFLCVLVAAGLLSACGDDKNPSKATGPSLTGTVTDATSTAALSGVAVAAQGKSATTAADGKYTLSDLTAGAATLTAQRQGHVNVSQSVTISGATTQNIAMTPSAMARMAGNWSGTWSNTTFGSSGGVTMQVTVDTLAQTARVVLDVNGSVFGAGDPPAETINGSYAESGNATATLTSAVLGTISVTVTPAGQVTVVCTGIPNPGISRVNFTGTVAGNAMNLAYVITFAGGTTANGAVGLTK
jgi:hypothetical protein